MKSTKKCPTTGTKAALKLSMGIYEFGQRRIEYLGKTHSSTDFTPIEKRVTEFLQKLKSD